MATSASEGDVSAFVPWFIVHQHSELKSVFTCNYTQIILFENHVHSAHILFLHTYPLPTIQNHNLHHRTVPQTVGSLSWNTQLAHPISKNINSPALSTHLWVNTSVETELIYVVKHLRKFLNCNRSLSSHYMHIQAFWSTDMRHNDNNQWNRDNATYDKNRGIMNQWKNDSSCSLTSLLVGDL